MTSVRSNSVRIANCAALSACTVAIVVTALALPATAQDWPQFRGPDGQGHSSVRSVPLTWSEEENVAWKVPIDGLGWSSPVVKDGRVWLTTATDDGRSLRALCLDAGMGTLIHDVEVFHRESAGRIHSKNSHASPTPVLDGDRVFVHFGTYGTACLSSDGEIVWQTRFEYNHVHGPGGSPVVFDDLLILSCDGADKQFVVALDKNKGTEVWRTPRKHADPTRGTGGKSVAMAFSTPLLVEIDGRTQVISTAADHVAGYDARTGKELWWSAYDGYSNVPRPVVGHGMVFVCSGFESPQVYAVRLGGMGNVTESHVAWSLARGAPLNPSPLLVGDELYLINDGGIATCVDAVSGKQHWQQRIGGKFSASPLYAAGRIYLTDENGTTTVVAPGTTFEKLAENKVDGRTLASACPQEGAILLRTDTHLYRIEEK